VLLFHDRHRKSSAPRLLTLQTSHPGGLSLDSRALVVMYHELYFREINGSHPFSISKSCLSLPLMPHCHVSFAWDAVLGHPQLRPLPAMATPIINIARQLSISLLFINIATPVFCRYTSG
jgi:hypothetical protein